MSVYLIIAVTAFLIGHRLGRHSGYKSADENWTNTLENLGWTRVSDEEDPDGPGKLEQKYADHWYQRRAEIDKEQ